MVDDTRLELVTSRTSSGCATSCANRPALSSKGYSTAWLIKCQAFSARFFKKRRKGKRPHGAVCAQRKSPRDAARRKREPPGRFPFSSCRVARALPLRAYRAVRPLPFPALFEKPRRKCLTFDKPCGRIPLA